MDETAQIPELHRPAISVYVVTRDRVRLLRRALRSVLAQTFRDFEVIVVDDCSSDATGRYVRALASNDRRVSYLRRDVHSGFNACRNAALRAARGTFATGLDDDDEIAPPHLESLYRAWQSLGDRQSSVSCLYFDYTFRVGDRVGGRSNRPTTTRLEDLPFGNTLGGHVFAPLRNYHDAGLYDPAMPVWTDYEFYFRLLGKFGPAILAGAPSYTYDVSPRPDRLSLQHKDRLMQAYQRICDRHLQDNLRARQALLFQVHAPHFGHPVSARELAVFLRMGVFGFGTARIMWYFLRRRAVVNKIRGLLRRQHAH